MRAKVRFYISLSLGLVVVFMFSTKTGRIPPIGSMMSPFEGVWRVIPKKRELLQEIDLEGHLKKDVRIVWDNYDVPHIYAETDEDLFFAQGFVEASQRLFQMDFQTRVAPGHLAEMFGKDVLYIDEFFVKIGMREYADVIHKEVLKNPLTKKAVEAYVKGVNAYINQIDASTLPMEYIIVDEHPQQWESHRVVNLLLLMTYRLAGWTSDLYLTRYAQKFGLEKVESLYPNQQVIQQPIISESVGIDNPRGVNVVPSLDFISSLKKLPGYLMPVKENGSNNWVVSGYRTKSGGTLLANDTHLGYSMPSIWYELQLRSPSFDAYGGTFPGAPGVLIGYNSKIAWAVTNGASDVIDWYEVKFEDEKSNRYIVDGQWKDAEVKIHEINVKGQVFPYKKKVLWTEFGPIYHREGDKGLAFKWIAGQPSNELATFLNLNNARSFENCLWSLQFFKKPVQNFICADRRHIGITHNGLFPKRAPFQGKYVLSGHVNAFKWVEYVDSVDVPRSFQTQKEFYRSANQFPVLYNEYPHYLGWSYMEPFRALAISELLEPLYDLEIKDFIELQNNVENFFARSVIPFMVNNVKNSILTESDAQILNDLHEWDHKDEVDDYRASVFHTWYRFFIEELFEDQLGPRKDAYYPAKVRVFELLRNTLSGENMHPDNFWVDDVRTNDKQESIYDILSASFKKALKHLEEEFGPFDKQKWSWGSTRKTHLNHVARIPGLGVYDLVVPGSQQTINSNKGNHGPAWKMVVELTDKAVGYTNYPGGQSGDPFDPEYDKFVSSWGKGEMRKNHYRPEWQNLEGEDPNIMILKAGESEEE